MSHMGTYEPGPGLGRSQWVGRHGDSSGGADTAPFASWHGRLGTFRRRARLSPWRVRVRRPCALAGRARGRVPRVGTRRRGGARVRGGAGGVRVWNGHASGRARVRLIPVSATPLVRAGTLRGLLLTKGCVRLVQTSKFGMSSVGLRPVDRCAYTIRHPSGFFLRYAVKTATSSSTDPLKVNLAACVKQQNPASPHTST